MVRVLSEEELKARDALRERMRREQEIRDSVKQQQPQNPQNQVERCPHGVPLSRSCRTCDVVTDDQIKDRVPLGRIGGE